MTIETIFETEDYRYDHDTLYGTGWFVRKSDDAVSLMDTGSDAESMKSLWNNRKEHIAAHPVFKSETNNIFDREAARATYSPRWDDENG